MQVSIANPPDGIWEEAIKTTIYTFNRSPHTTLQRSKKPAACEIYQSLDMSLGINLVQVLSGHLPWV